MWKAARSMNIKMTYPVVPHRRALRKTLISCCKWTFLFAGLLCVVINASTGGKGWSAVAIWSMWIIWSQLVSPDIIEYNHISQTIKLTVNCCILLVLIDRLLIPCRVARVVPIVCYSALIIVAVVFFTDFETQRLNMFPMLIFCALCLIGSIIEIVSQPTANRRPFAIMGAIALLLLIGCAAKFGKSFWGEIKKYFCEK